MINNKIENKQGGFLRLIVIIIIAYFLMRYLHITISDVFNWFKAIINSIS
jgi:hypothetical protein